MTNGLRILLSTVICYLTAPTAAGELPESLLPSWQTLVYEQRTFWATARSRIVLDTCESPTDWCADIESEVSDNREKISLRTDAFAGLLSRERYSQGRDRRKKSWSYTNRVVRRLRLEPTEAADWQQTSDRLVRYPENVSRVTDAYLLLALATAHSAQEFVVHTDLNFYRVALQPAGEDLIKAADTLALPGGTHREVDLVSVVASPVGEPLDKADFSLLGLSGELLIALDRETALPLQLRGRAPRLGQVEINLTNVTLRSPSQ